MFLNASLSTVYKETESDQWLKCNRKGGGTMIKAGESTGGGGGLPPGNEARGSAPQKFFIGHRAV